MGDQRQDTFFVGQHLRRGQLAPTQRLLGQSLDELQLAGVILHLQTVALHRDEVR